MDVVQSNPGKLLPMKERMQDKMKSFSPIKELRNFSPMKEMKNFPPDQGGEEGDGEDGAGGEVAAQKILEEQDWT